MLVPFDPHWSLSTPIGPFRSPLVPLFKTGDVMWSDAQTHIGVNVGNT